MTLQENTACHPFSGGNSGGEAPRLDTGEKAPMVALLSWEIQHSWDLNFYRCRLCTLMDVAI